MQSCKMKLQLTQQVLRDTADQRRTQQRSEREREAWLLIFKGVLSKGTNVQQFGNEATIIDGRTVADGIKRVVSTEVELIKRAGGRVPGLAVILVGTRRDSDLYVHNKTAACAETGIASLCTKLPERVSKEEIIAVVKKYSKDPSSDGVLVQLPLPQVITGFQGYMWNCL